MHVNTPKSCNTSVERSSIGQRYARVIVRATECWKIIQPIQLCLNGQGSSRSHTPISRMSNKMLENNPTSQMIRSFKIFQPVQHRNSIDQGTSRASTTLSLTSRTNLGSIRAWSRALKNLKSIHKPDRLDKSWTSRVAQHTSNPSC